MQEGTVPKSEISKTCSCDAHSKERWHGSKYPSNFRPVSNLACLAKILEKAINNRLDGYLTANKLYYPLQSAYKNSAQQKQHWLKLRMTLWFTWTKAVVWRYFC